MLLSDNNHKVMKQIKFFSLSIPISIFLIIVLSGILRSTGSGGDCLEFSICLGVWTPPSDFNSTVSFLHRLLTLIVGILLVGGVMVGYIQYRLRRPAWPYYFSAVIFLIQIIIDRILFTSGDKSVTSWLPTVHLGFSLLILTLMTASSVLTFLQGNTKYRMSFNTRFSKLAITTLAILLGVFISGAVINRSGVSSTCTSWPLCEDMINPNGMIDWINLVHRVSVLVVGVLLLMLVSNAWRNYRSNTFVLVSTTAAFVLFYSQALLASQMVGAYPVYQLLLHQSTAVAVWAALIIQITYTGIANFNSTQDRQIIVQKEGDLFGKMKDLFMLTKPIVVALLLITTYAGMVIGGEEFPNIHLTFWTLLGGFLAAGGSGAINQYIDRFDDGKMQRTQKRPIPSGRLTPGEGLAFGIAMTLVSFYVMVAFVNLPAALLTLAGIVYYVFIYSIFLKKTTVQNIVIGGGAGAIPPLVGWASATGGLNIPSLFLFAVVFMWTPPHFWALALVRRKDYARAGVPMLPVIRGETETRWQILLYTIELFVLTLVLPIFGLGSSIYLIGATLLGIWLLSAAWRVWKHGGNKSAWKMYRYSSMYLAFLFMALMLDALI
jgi:heme o synthase